jgi:hypothetical protein
VRCQIHTAPSPRTWLSSACIQKHCRASAHSLRPNTDGTPAAVWRSQTRSSTSFPSNLLPGYAPSCRPSPLPFATASACGQDFPVLRTHRLRLVVRFQGLAACLPSARPGTTHCSARCLPCLLHAWSAQLEQMVPIPLTKLLAWQHVHSSVSPITPIAHPGGKNPF